MQLTRHTDLALRVLIYLATRLDRKRVVTIAEVADFYRASHEHLRKVVHRLGKLGFIASRQGRNGGIRLARPLEQINVADVIEAMEQDMSIVDCDALNCVLKGPCSLKHALAQAQAAFLAVLREYTLERLVGDRATMARIVRIVRLRAA